VHAPADTSHGGFRDGGLIPRRAVDAEDRDHGHRYPRAQKPTPAAERLRADHQRSSVSASRQNRFDDHRDMTLTLSRILRIAGSAFAAIAVLLLVAVFLVKGAVSDEQHATARQAELKQLGLDLAAASDRLTGDARQFAVTADPAYLTSYWREVEQTKTRDHVVAKLKQLGVSDDLLALVEEAKQRSDGLVATESRSMRLVLDATHAPAANVPAALRTVQLSDADRALSDVDKQATAQRIMFDKRYAADKASINAPMTRFQQLLNGRAAKEAADARSKTDLWLIVLIAMAILMPLVVALVGWVFFKQVAVPVRDYSRALRDRDRSDLSFALQPEGVQELTELADAFNEQFQANQQVTERLLGDLTGVISEVTQTASSVSAASQQMATSSEEAGRAVSEIANAVGDVAQGAERQVRMTEAARESAQATAEAAEVASRVAVEGTESAQRAAEAMQAVRSSTGEVTDAIRSLADKSEQIGGIVATITGIAEQTNLLALNAAIEAARAGEQGRGFAVVAEEVRKLAEESQAAAGTISTLVVDIQSETERAVAVVEDGAERSQEGTQIVEQARAAFLQISDAVRDVGARVEDITQATAEVATVAEQSSASTEQVSASSQETSASTQEIAASAQELAVTAQRLDGLVGAFRF
jgi:methyl-accepting chemotaxis protein